VHGAVSNGGLAGVLVEVRHGVLFIAPRKKERGECERKEKQMTTTVTQKKKKKIIEENSFNLARSNAPSKN
jgi:hypothetical protein